MAKHIHMVGIGGVGMSALAQLFANEGVQVTGSDRAPSPTTEMLLQKGITVIFGQKAENVSPEIDLLVYSDAVPEDNPERIVARERGVSEKSYFAALGDIATTKRTIAISGTHGKTTTTAMLAKILIDGGADPTVVVGSIVSEWGSNFRAGKSDLLVVEACEYRDHFLAFKPEVLVITNIELDHTDYFKDLAQLNHAFDEIRKQAKTVIEREAYQKEKVPELLVPGEFNRENARAAKAAAHVVAPQISEGQIDLSLQQFKGTWRRFEYKGKLSGGAALYDDYAHHPTAIARTIEAARETFPGKKIVLFFHPHLYSRTRDLFGEFAQALSQADEAYILPVYAAREPHDPTVSHEALAIAATKKGGRVEPLQTMEEVVQKLRTLDASTVAFTMGAGDIYKAGEQALL